MDAYIVFKSVHDVMKMDAILSETTLEYKLVPVPRKISESCGISIKMAETAADDFMRIADEHGAEFQKIIIL